MEGQEHRLTMRACVAAAAVLLELDDVTAALEGGEAEEETQRRIDRLVQCGNLVLNEIALEYLPTVRRETVRPTDGRVTAEALSAPPVKVVAVRQGGRKLRCRDTADGVTVSGAKEGAVEVEYRFVPQPLDLNGIGEYTAGRPSARTVAYGIACEYCLIGGMSDEAAVWDKRYKDSLSAAQIPARELRVRARQWR